MAFLIALSLSLSPAVVDEVDVIELNHVYAYSEASREYEQRLVQFIYYRDGHVVSWEMWDKTNHAYPIKVKGGYRLTYFDGKLLRVIKSRAFIRTKANYDHEVEERRRLPVIDRAGLSMESPWILPYEG